MGYCRFAIAVVAGALNFGISQDVLAQDLNQKSKSSGANELQFMLYMGLNTTFDGKNATCYSRVVSVPAPSPRWKTKDQRSVDYEAAMKIVKSHHDEFVSLCGKWGKPASSHVGYGINDRYRASADDYYKTYRDSFPDGKGEVVLNP